MLARMEEGGGDVEDELFDLNKEPVERKRKRVETDSIDSGQQGFDVLPQVVGRVLRSKTMAEAECGRQAIDLKVVKIEVENESEVSMLPERGKKKDRRGRPRKIQGKDGVSSLKLKEKSGVSVKQEKTDESSKGTNRRWKKMKRGRGRPPKVDTGAAATETKKEKVECENDKVSFFNRREQNNDHHKKDERGSGMKRMKRMKADPNELGNEIVWQAKGKEECAKGKDMGRREQQQLVRDQIVVMLKKAGWTIDLRQRQQREYMDAVYIDREGRTHWSVTLAYRKFKEKIDSGNADSIDVSAFNLIPEESLSTLFRVTEKGKKASKKKKGGANTINRIAEKVSSKSKLSDGGISRSGRGRGRTLLARKPGVGSDGDYELYEGKRTLISWMIDLGTIPLGGKVAYKSRRHGKRLLEGRVTKDGLSCDCCGSMHTIQDFEAHAGGKHGNPFNHICMDSGNSLLQCLENSWKKHLETNYVGFVAVDVDGDDPNDDTCNFCGDGGNLICCDSCPSTFHHGCLCIEVPSGDWHCMHCSCKFCGKGGETDSMADDNEDSNVAELFTCLLCEEKFHVHCTQGNVAENFDYRDHPSFCSMECLKIFEHLQVIGTRYELEEGFTYTILQCRDECINEDCTVEEINSKLAVAFTVMDECFEPIIDERSETNVIHSVVYNCGSNIRRLDFGGFYTIVLEKGDELVAAASIRIHGSQLAEMPFIGTRYMYRRQGMCKRLLNAIEKVLNSLGVEKLVIPAISELNETWTNKFGFVPLEESKRKEMKYMSLMVFPGIDMLQKTVFEHRFHEGQMNSAVESGADLPDSAAVTGSVGVEDLHQNSLEQNNDKKTSSLDTCTAKIDGSENKVGAVESGPARSSDETIDSKNGVCVNESHGQESCVNDLDASKCSKSFLKDSASADCKLEAKQSDDGFRLPLVTGSL
ncbi:uncharacterized protein [Primulina huaijiensis]|uniref:uncharacterized protein isoform X2 n=1 Tax=Primulina huaijiensis TaxID=1492673 RepID=UPI003CC75BFC